jgi:hypothetical protein
MRSSASILALAAAIALLSPLGTTALAQTGCTSETFSATSVNRGENMPLLASSVDINIARWSTEREKDVVARTLLDSGAESLLTLLRHSERLGEIRTPTTLPYDLRFAWQERLDDGGRRVVLIADRPMVVWKDAMRLDSATDTFTVIEIRLNADGEGEGKVAIGANITVNRSLDLIELAQYDGAPVRLADVRSIRPTS